MIKSLDTKLARIHADPARCKDFILADAKDPDMDTSIDAPRRSPESHPGESPLSHAARVPRHRDADRRTEKSRRHHAHVRQYQRSADKSTSVSSTSSPVTPAARAQRPTDIHIIRGSKYPTQPSLPFRTATLDHIQCGHLDCKPEHLPGTPNLGLYSITYNNDTTLDRRRWRSTSCFATKRNAKISIRFLEVFDPNRPEVVEASRIPEFINDAIVRTLGGVTGKGRPLFLKMVYHGPKAMQELVHYDPHLVVSLLRRFSRHDALMRSNC